MNVKYKKVFFIAILVSLSVGVFLIINGALEFTGILKTIANNEVKTLGVQSSHLIFVSGVLLFISGVFSAVNFRTLRYFSMQMFLGVISLAWPILVAMSLFLSQQILCIRLTPALLAALFYVIAIMVIKIGNEELTTRHMIKGNIKIGEKRKRGIDIISVVKGNNKESKSDSMPKKRRHKKASVSGGSKMLLRKLTKRRTSLHYRKKW